ncbi:MAG: bifunctional methionine sulfoxide reductase B/A protein [Lewinellaceae bacterium]|nr:bifunctional methionine sulfoxide reductase B/A protein [Saprospiraceae bacterium]MCB9339030.1 bifunctional methionine sulfoxide reductase B/A protein [Lewinellaceae bacterium]
MFYLILLFVGIFISACAQKPASVDLSRLPAVITNPAKYNPLQPNEARVILQQGTEYAFSGAYHDYKKDGIYICKQCNNPLFRAADKFDSGTGWPSFDDIIEGAVKELPDEDGSRTEIVCANCGGHLGHVFRGEGFTKKMTRHCVNSVSLNFVGQENPKKKSNPDGVQPIAEYIKGKGYEKYETAIFAGGCFWCTEAALDRINGVADVISGYSGGSEKYPTYEEVGAGNTDHAEAIILYFDPQIVSYETLLDVFFTAHDPTQLNRQGPDVGRQYRSAIFYQNEEQETLAKNTIEQLNKSGKFDKPIVTELKPYEEFWVAEAYHQNYYELHPENPYVQRVSRPKVEKVKKVFSEILKPEFK